MIGRPLFGYVGTVFVRMVWQPEALPWFESSEERNERSLMRELRDSGKWRPRRTNQREGRKLSPSHGAAIRTVLSPSVALPSPLLPSSFRSISMSSTPSLTVSTGSRSEAGSPSLNQGRIRAKSSTLFLTYYRANIVSVMAGPRWSRGGVCCPLGLPFALFAPLSASLANKIVKNYFEERTRSARCPGRKLSSLLTPPRA